MDTTVADTGTQVLDRLTKLATTHPAAEPKQITELATAVLGCDTLNIIITPSN